MAALKWLAIPADIIVLIATATLVACLFAEATQEVISVRPFDLPKEMRREGWNGEITARHFADALRKIEIGARPRPLGVPQGMEPQSWSSEIAAGYFASALLEIEARPGQQAFPLRPERALPNIEVPQTGVSAAALVDVFRFLVRNPRREVTAEIIGCSGAYRLHGRLEGGARGGDARFDIAVSGPDRLRCALQEAADELTRAVSLPHYLLFLLPQRSRALSVAQQVIDHTYGSVGDQVFAAKFATCLMLAETANADIDEIPGLIAKAKHLAAQAKDLSPSDGDAVFLFEVVEALPAVDWNSNSKDLEKLTDFWDHQGARIVGFCTKSPKYRDLILAIQIFSLRLGFISQLKLLQRQIDDDRNRLKCGLKRAHKSLGTEQLSAIDLEHISLRLAFSAKVIAVNTALWARPHISDTDVVALNSLARLLNRTAASVENHTARLLSAGYFQTTQAESIRGHLAELSQSLKSWCQQSCRNRAPLAI